MSRQSGTLASHMRRSRLWRFAALVLLFATLVGVSRWQQRRSKAEPQRPAGVTEADARAFLALERKEQEAERTVWAGEIDAQRHEDVFLALWDTLNHALEPLTVLAQFSFEDLRIGGTNAVQELQHGIRRITFRDAAPETFVKHLDPAEWRTALDAWRTEGWQLGRTSWQETRFTPATLQRAAKSVIGSSARWSNESRGMRAILRGDLEVEWKSDGVATAVPVPRIIAARRLELLVRTGTPPFTESFSAELTPAANSIFADPLLLHDLDGDGDSEILMVGANKLFRNVQGTFRDEPLAALPAGRVFAALVADFTSDGRADLLVAGSDGLVLFESVVDALARGGSLQAVSR